jgi:hypothetical protein
MFNAGSEPAEFSIPAPPGAKVWHLVVDTFRSTPEDLFDPRKEPSLRGIETFHAAPRSSAILLAHA